MGGFRAGNVAVGVAAFGTFAITVFAAATASAQAPPPSAFPGEAPEGPPAIILEFRVEPSAIMPGRLRRWPSEDAWFPSWRSRRSAS